MLVNSSPAARPTKKTLAMKLGVSRSSLYYQRKRPTADQELKVRIEMVLKVHPFYGHRRIAIELGSNKKRIRRVMKLFGLQPISRRKRPKKEEDEGKPASEHLNLIKGLCPIRPDVVWVSDFTYIPYQGGFIYLATIMDLFSREIIGWHVSRYHDAQLVLDALKHAVGHAIHRLPVYLHSDQGSEYESHSYARIVAHLGIKFSASAKASPWQNGYQESFYSQFKLELGDPGRFEQFGQLIEAIHQQIRYYNYDRIHTALKKSPVQFYNSYQSRLFRPLDKVS